MTFFPFHTILIPMGCEGRVGCVCCVEQPKPAAVLFSALSPTQG